MKRCKYIDELIKKGVIVEDKNNVIIEESTSIAAGVIIESNVHILGSTTIMKGCHIGSGSYIVSSTICNDVNIQNSVIEHAYIGDMTTVGPFAHIHKESHIGSNVRIGNFVEVKNSNIGDGSKCAHLAYVGDADIGRMCNIGCGAIFVNYDGEKKYRSTIEDGVFIGSNVNVIAPRHIKKGAYVAAGSTLTIDLDEDDMCIARAREVVKEGRSKYKKL